MYTLKRFWSDALVFFHTFSTSTQRKAKRKSKGFFPLMIRINLHARCEYFHTIAMLESLF